MDQVEHGLELRAWSAQWCSRVNSSILSLGYSHVLHMSALGFFQVLQRRLRIQGYLNHDEVVTKNDLVKASTIIALENKGSSIMVKGSSFLKRVLGTFSETKSIVWILHRTFFPEYKPKNPYSSLKNPCSLSMVWLKLYLRQLIHSFSVMVKGSSLVKSFIWNSFGGGHVEGFINIPLSHRSPPDKPHLQYTVRIIFTTVSILLPADSYCSFCS